MPQAVQERLLGLLGSSPCFHSIPPPATNLRSWDAERTNGFHGVGRRRSSAVARLDERRAALQRGLGGCGVDWPVHGDGLDGYAVGHRDREALDLTKPECAVERYARQRRAEREPLEALVARGGLRTTRGSPGPGPGGSSRCGRTSLAHARVRSRGRAGGGRRSRAGAAGTAPARKPTTRCRSFARQPAPHIQRWLSRALQPTVRGHPTGSTRVQEPGMTSRGDSTALR